jgi:LuxR family maltose regulon positive regulatory protein
MTQGSTASSLLRDGAPGHSRVPPLRGGTLRRERLLHRLEQAADVPITVLVAPAGYGKTTLLAHWLERDPRDVVWVSIDESDNDGDRFAGSIASAARDVVSRRRATPLLRLAPTDGGAGFTADVASALHDAKRPFVLALDDVHRLRSPRALKAVRAIADAVPQGSQLALASRQEPSLPIGRWRADGRLVDIRQVDLAMTRREAAGMLSLTGVELSPRDVLVLFARTEGWPAGLYLAALSLRGKQDTHRAIARFDGDDRLFADYLRAELLADLGDEQRAFLRRTSLLDELSGPLCDALLESQGSGEVLRDMSRANVLLVPLDSADSAYRYHGALARMLQAELTRVEPQFGAELHRRASRWYTGAGDTARAISHSLAGGDTAGAAQLLWPAVAARVLDGETANVRRSIAPLSAAQAAGHPALALTVAATYLVEGDRGRVEHWTAAAAGSEDPDIDAAIALLRAAAGQEGMVGASTRAFAALPDDSPWRALCCFLQGVGTLLGGEPDAARTLLEEGARRGAIAGRYVQALCLAQLALIALDEDDVERAALLASRARAQVERLRLGDQPTCALVYAVSSLVRGTRAHVEDARADRQRAADLLARLEEYAPWYEIQTRLVLARSALRLGDVTGTRTLLAEASRMLARLPDALVLRRWTDELWSLVDTFATTVLVAPSSLTTAELRVLSLMPTHLTFREMGDRLHVSANTVKTHAHAVYRKLDVSSRSEAVVTACATGLLAADDARS